MFQILWLCQVKKKKGECFVIFFRVAMLPRWALVWIVYIRLIRLDGSFLYKLMIIFISAILCFWADALRSSHMWLWVSSFTQRVLSICWSDIFTVLLPSWHMFCMHHAPVYSVIWNRICSVHVCLAVTCHLHFRQSDWDLLCATVVATGIQK